ISKMFGAAEASSTSAQAGAAAVAWAPAAIAASIATMGAAAGVGTAAYVAALAAGTASTMATGAIGAALSFGGMRAEGGGVDPSKRYVVGENGPEIFAPGASGTIIPNHDIAGAMTAGMARPDYGATRGGGGAPGSGGVDMADLAQRITI